MINRPLLWDAFDPDVQKGISTTRRTLSEPVPVVTTAKEKSTLMPTPSMLLSRRATSDVAEYSANHDNTLPQSRIPVLAL